MEGNITQSLKWVVYGGNGWIGTQLRNMLNEAGDVAVVGTRVTTYEELVKELTVLKPDRIICSLGRTSGKGYNTIDYLEDKLKENLDCNMEPILLLA